MSKMNKYIFAVKIDGKNTTFTVLARSKEQARNFLVSHLNKMGLEKKGARK